MLIDMFALGEGHQACEACPLEGEKREWKKGGQLEHP